MKAYDTAAIRNVAMIGHGASGKTTLTSAMLYRTGAVSRMGKTEDGSAVTDFDDEEISRNLSLQTALAHVEWDGTKINLLDTPGYADFVADAKAGIAVADAALLTVEGVAGVEVLTAKTFRWTEARQLPVVFVVSKLDRERASFSRCLEEIQERFGRTAVPIQLPIGEEDGFVGVLDLISMKARRYSGEGLDAPTEVEIPEDLSSAAEEARSNLMEMIAESDEQLMEAYFEAGELTESQLTDGLRVSIRERKIFPVTCTAAIKMIGAEDTLNLIVRLLPAPDALGPARGVNPEDDSEATREVQASEPISLFVFKTIADPFAGRLSLFRVCSGTAKADSGVVNVRTGNPERLGSVSLMQGKTLEQIGELHSGDLGAAAKLKETQTNDTLADPAHKISYPAIDFPAPAISFALEPKSKGDEEKISGALTRLTEEDPVLQVGRDARTHETLVSGTSQAHVEVAMTKMKKKFGVEALLKAPKVPYLETIRKKVGPIEGRHKKQSGGRGQFGVCVISMEPLKRGENFEFVDKIFGGSIPQNYRPAVEKGIQENAAKGVLAGFPVVDFRVTLLDGKYHNVDSSEMAFKIAGSLAFQGGVKQANPVLLEPIMQVEITAPEEYMGDIMGDLSSRRGKPQGMDTQGRHQVIRAEVPMAEMLTYASTLKSITSDRGSYHMEFDHYADVPAQIQQQIIAEANKAKEHEA
jgi:elongation factor G